MERAVEIFAVINLAIIGLSHVVAPRAWAQFFLWLRAKEETGVLVAAFLSLVFGSIVVAFHRVWSGIPLVLTLLGCAQVLKAAIYLCFPRVGLRRLAWIALERSHVFIYPGLVLVAIAGLIAYHVFSDVIEQAAAV